MKLVVLKVLPLDLLAPMVEESTRLGYCHVQRLVDEWAQGINRFDQVGEGLFGVLSEEVLWGVGGLNQDPFAQNVRFGRVRRLYVMASARGQGVGLRLMRHIEQVASTNFDKLVANVNPYAFGFFEQLDFIETPDQPHWTHEKRF